MSAPRPPVTPAASQGLRGLPDLLRGRDLRRLLGVRLLSQAGDGAFQLALAGLLLFSPERAPTPLAVVGLLALVLLPYTLVGPLVGTLLDRWRRRSVLVGAGALRAVAVLATALLVASGAAAPGSPGEPLLVPAVLLVLSVNRLVLAALGAGLPAVVAGRDLVLASSVVPTVGTLALALGAGAGTGLRLLVGADPASSVTADALVLALAASLVGASSLAALRLRPDALGGGADRGPGRGRPRRAGRAALEAVHELREGLRHLGDRPAAARAVTALGASRVAYGVLVVLVVVLTRTRLAPLDDPDAALALTGLVLGAVTAGVALAVAATPSGAAHLGARRWGAGCLVLAALAAAVLAALLPVGPAALAALVGAGAALGAGGQGLKICVDAVVLRSVGGAHRGRVVAVHDAVFNGSFVLGALAAASVLPAGPSDAAVAALLLPLAVVLLGAAVLLLRSPDVA